MGLDAAGDHGRLLICRHVQGSSSVVKVVLDLLWKNPAPAGLSRVGISTGGVQVGLLWKVRDKRAWWKVQYSGSEAEGGRTAELSFPHSHFIDGECSQEIQ